MAQQPYNRKFVAPQSTGRHRNLIFTSTTGRDTKPGALTEVEKSYQLNQLTPNLPRLKRNMYNKTEIDAIHNRKNS